MWCGPHVGAVVADPGLLMDLEPEKLAPVPDRVPDRFESGGGALALLARGSPPRPHPASPRGPQRKKTPLDSPHPQYSHGALFFQKKKSTDQSYNSNLSCSA